MVKTQIIDCLFEITLMFLQSIIFISETWLSSEVQDQELLIPDCRWIRLDRNHHGGRVLKFDSFQSYLESLSINVHQYTNFILLGDYIICNPASYFLFSRLKSFSCPCRFQLAIGLWKSANQEYETEIVVLGRRQLYTSLLVSTETNREASEGASIFCYAQLAHSS